MLILMKNSKHYFNKIKFLEIFILVFCIKLFNRMIIILYQEI